MAALPREFGNLSSAATITRAHVAALRRHQARHAHRDGAASRRSRSRPTCASHWASPWILPVTRAGVMDVVPEPHFPARHHRPAERSGASGGAAGCACRAPPGRRNSPAGGPRGRVSRPARDQRVLRPAALAVAAGRMSADGDGGFQPTRPATGADLAEAPSRASASSPPGRRRHGRAHRSEPADAAAPAARAGVRAVHAVRPAGLGAA